MEEALQYIESNYSEPVTIQDLANWLNLERTYLYRLFKSMVGVSPPILSVGCKNPASLHPFDQHQFDHHQHGTFGGL